MKDFNSLLLKLLILFVMLFVLAFVGWLTPEGVTSAVVADWNEILTGAGAVP